MSNTRVIVTAVVTLSVPVREDLSGDKACGYAEAIVDGVIPMLPDSEHKITSSFVLESPEGKVH